jgi:hypothetical protein
MLEDKISGAKKTIVKNYVVPRLGLRFSHLKRYYMLMPVLVGVLI